MTIIQAIILGIVQGITEFLPVSSSGHLVIIPFILGWDLPKDQIFPFDVLIQIGTLIAVVVFYWKDITQIAHSMIQGIQDKKPFEEIQARIGWLAILATIPAGFAGLLLKQHVEDAFTRPSAAGALLIVTAVILFVSEKIGKKSKDITAINKSDAIVMGVFQALSIFPGISRSGSTISGGLLKNLDRKTAGQFTFLMAIPIMAAAGMISFIDLLKIPDLAQFLPVMGVGFFIAGIVGFFSIRWLIRYITHHSLLPFSIYCLTLGIGTLVLSTTNPTIVPGNHETTAGKDFYHISYSSSVQWMLPIINECSKKTPGTTLLYNQSDNDVFPSGSDVHISYDELSSTTLKIYQLGNDHLVPAAPKDSPIINLTPDALRGLYQGNITTINDLADECAECLLNEKEDTAPEETFHVWGYSEESYLNKTFQSAFQVDFLTPNLSIAPNPSLMQQALSLETNAVGILPNKAIGDQLKSIPLIDAPDIQKSIPILASSQTEPDTAMTALLICVQENINE
ncbi:MAG: undecaprenyl-diphosphatase UppP [Anaerolineaceae bacterium]|nr:undecaprenyl-diphosphatase UppP [Anaerolineaceae bacterium]